MKTPDNVDNIEYGFVIENHINHDNAIEKSVCTLRLGDKNTMFGEIHVRLGGFTGVWFAPKPEQSELDNLKNKISEGQEMTIADMGALLLIECDDLNSWDAVIEAMQRARDMLAEHLEGKNNG